jgi:hypothetical protein
VSVTVAQDTIRGTYSYTYGDKESLVEARSTCKDLALREAIESYYIFVESSTDVENFQLKEDIIKSITAGYVKNVQIVDQNEEGRTITMTVEATVDPDEVKELVGKLVMSQGDEETPTASDASTQPLLEVDDASSPFLSALANYENQMQSMESAWGERKYDVALNNMQELKSFLAKYKPSEDKGFQWLIYQCISTRIEVLNDLLRAERFESMNQRVRYRANLRLANKKATDLRGLVESLEKYDNLSGKLNKLKRAVVKRCRTTIDRVQNKVKSVGRG